jgi:hypothetical protein
MGRNPLTAGLIGERIEVTGVLTTQQQASTMTPPAPPANKPTGTAGTRRCKRRQNSMCGGLH